MICNKCKNPILENQAVWEHPFKKYTKRLKPVCKECHTKAVNGHLISKEKCYCKIRGMVMGQEDGYKRRYHDQ